ncbi:MAG: Crp/Fnr family transcriptional regulator [Acidobacteria bacterium]|nr:Crp/Fnr family transcriptional regulator [Acidobacteriota bacterium]MCA1636906.1 Crp/Fnr family transcriptional regulator [Acidobacteriota bacterium]
MYNYLTNTGLKRSTEKPFVSRAENQQFSSTGVLHFREESTNKILDALPTNELARLLPFVENINFSGGEVVYQPDDAVRYVYFPGTSVFSQSQILEDGRMCEIAMTGREGLIGLPELLSCQPTNYWTEVSIGGSAIRIEGYILEREFKANGLLQTKIIEFVSRYIGQISQRVICNCHHQIKERFCSWLLMLEDRHGSNQFSLTQERIARFLGVHRPSLSCIAREFQESDVISYSRGQFVIVNRRELKRLACSCYMESQVIF